MRKQCPKCRWFLILPEKILGICIALGKPNSKAKRCLRFSEKKESENDNSK